MARLQSAIAALHEVDMGRGGERNGSSIHPLARFVVCLGYLVTVVSFEPYDLWGLMGMSLYLIITGIWEDISIGKGLCGLRYALFAVCFLGLVNLFYDRSVLYKLAGISVTGGMLSFATLFFKSIFTVSAMYCLLRLIGMNGLCRALRRLGIPGGAVTVLLLTWRYLIVLLKEIDRMGQAYMLRAPGQKGIHIRAWGPFVGLLLLRSMDRPETVYQSMLLRGYDGGFRQAGMEKGERTGISILYAVSWIGIFGLLRIFPVFVLAGRLLTGMG